MQICNYGCGQEAKHQFKNGKWCCSKSYASCPAHRKNRFFINANNTKTPCRFCKKLIGKSGIKKHEKFCYLNPKNLKICPVCDNPIRNYRENTTCSYACSNTYFRSGESAPNWKGNIFDYNTNTKNDKPLYHKICFTYHKKQCVVCGETLIVAVHHFDGNKNNNYPTNLIPLCPTHHQYWHSKYRYLIEEKILTYILDFIKTFEIKKLKHPFSPLWSGYGESNPDK